MRHEYGLDRPVVVQYALWMGRVLTGDFGVSMMWRRPVTEVIGDRLWLTMAVSISALFLTWIIALPIGIYSAARQYSVGDYIATMIGFIGSGGPELPARLDPDVCRVSLFRLEHRRAVFA